MLMRTLSDDAKQALDSASIGALVATLFEWLPEITALAVFAWTCLRIYESLLAIRLKRRALGGRSDPAE